jgi:ABC-type antimicrobial peptide transport system permease subunit
MGGCNDLGFATHLMLFFVVVVFNIFLSYFGFCCSFFNPEKELAFISLWSTSEHSSEQTSQASW